MADTKVSAMTAASALDGTELLKVVQGGNDRKATAQAIADLVAGSGTPGGSSGDMQYNASASFGGMKWTYDAVTAHGMVWNATSGGELSYTPFQTQWSGGNTFKITGYGNIEHNDVSGTNWFIQTDASKVLVAANAGFALISTYGGLRFNKDKGVSWSGTTTWSDSGSAGVYWASAGVVEVNNGTAGGGGALRFNEMTAPSAPAANTVVLYAEDNGSGKTRLMARFPTGAAQQVAIEP